MILQLQEILIQVETLILLGIQVEVQIPLGIQVEVLHITQVEAQILLGILILQLLTKLLYFLI